MVAPVLMKYGSDAQKPRYLPRILDGTDWWCQGYSEPGSGSDLASLRTRADRAGRSLRRQRPEDLDHARPARRHDVLPRAHRSRREEAGGHLVPSDRHEDAGHHRASDHHARRGSRSQRSLLRGREGAGRKPRRRGESRLDLREVSARPRAHGHCARRAVEARARVSQATRAERRRSTAGRCCTIPSSPRRSPRSKSN